MLVVYRTLFAQSHLLLMLIPQGVLSDYPSQDDVLFNIAVSISICWRSVFNEESIFGGEDKLIAALAHAVSNTSMALSGN